MVVAEYSDESLDTEDDDAPDVEEDDDDESTSASEGLANRISEMVESSGLADEFMLHLEFNCTDAEGDCLL